MTIKVAIRKKPISGGKSSLYLNINPPTINLNTGKPIRKEYLGLHVFDEAKKPTEKLHNKNTMLTAEMIRQKRENELSKPEIYSVFEREQLKKNQKQEGNFIDYFKKLGEKKNESNRFLWLGSCDFLKSLKGDVLRFSEIDTLLCDEFREFLETTKSKKSKKMQLSPNSIKTYLDKFRSALRQAYKDGYLSENIADKTEAIKQAETQRNFLTLEELNSLAITDCKSPEIKMQALFSALTGLRRSDIQKLIWGEIQYIDGRGYFIRFMQKKTGGSETLPISDQAFDLLGERRQPEDNVFTLLKATNQRENRYLSKWVLDAGITKKITFHCFRHTFATLQLTAGTDIYTVSKMLGHKDLNTTQIYAKIVDEKKREASNRIVIDFNTGMKK